MCLAGSSARLSVTGPTWTCGGVTSTVAGGIGGAAAPATGGARPAGMGDGLATGLGSPPPDADGAPETEAETHPAATKKLPRGAANPDNTFFSWWTAGIVRSPDIEQISSRTL